MGMGGVGMTLQAIHNPQVQTVQKRLAFRRKGLYVRGIGHIANAHAHAVDGPVMLAKRDKGGVSHRMGLVVRYDLRDQGRFVKRRMGQGLGENVIKALVHSVRRARIQKQGQRRPRPHIQPPHIINPMQMIGVAVG